jgi:hypothetical protein
MRRIPPSRIFLLSPAHCGGRRAQMLISERAQFELAQRLRNEGATLAEIFTFLSGLYFRGKVAYARAFARPPAGVAGALVITTNRGLVPLDAALRLADLQRLGTVSIEPDEPRYAGPLIRDATAIAAIPDCEVVLLGSVASGKYVDPLLPLFGARLRFPAEFVGRGDMSRGGLMLRCAANREELEYIAVHGATRRGARPPKLKPLR